MSFTKPKTKEPPGIGKRVRVTFQGVGWLRQDDGALGVAFLYFSSFGDVYVTAFCAPPREGDEIHVCGGGPRNTWRRQQED